MFCYIHSGERLHQIKFSFSCLLLLIVMLKGECLSQTLLILSTTQTIFPQKVFLVIKADPLHVAGSAPCFMVF